MRHINNFTLVSKKLTKYINPGELIKYFIIFKIVYKEGK